MHVKQPHRGPDPLAASVQVANRHMQQACHSGGTTGSTHTFRKAKSVDVAFGSSCASKLSSCSTPPCWGRQQPRSIERKSALIHPAPCSPFLLPALLVCTPASCWVIVGVYLSVKIAFLPVVVTTKVPMSSGHRSRNQYTLKATLLWPEMTCLSGQEDLVGLPRWLVHNACQIIS
jgi:hypothetical protein